MVKSRTHPLIVSKNNYGISLFLIIIKCWDYSLSGAIIFLQIFLSSYPFSPITLDDSSRVSHKTINTQNDSFWIQMNHIEITFFWLLKNVFSRGNTFQKSDKNGPDIFLKIKSLQRPGIEPGPPAWQARILPLNQRCLFERVSKPHYILIFIEVFLTFSVVFV